MITHINRKIRAGAAILFFIHIFPGWAVINRLEKTERGGEGKVS